MLDRMYKTAQYVLSNPWKVLTLSLASQVLVSSALNNFQKTSYVNLAQGLHLSKSFLNDNLVLIEHRALPILNLAQLNQTILNPVEFVSKVQLDTNDTFLDKNIHRTKREDPSHLEKEGTIEDCITAIRNGDLKKVKESLRGILTLDHSIETLRKIIREAYGGNLCNFDKVDSFIFDVLGSVGLKLIAYEELMLQIRKYNQLFTSETLRLAYRLDQVMNYPGFKITPQMESFCESVKSKLPQAANYLLHKSVCLRSVAQKEEYLYASWFKMSNDTGKHVFTWIPNEYAGVQAVWRFESFDDGKTFYIYNPTQHAYLHAIEDKYDDDRRYITAQSTKGLLGKWRIQLAATKSEIILWNDYYGETLYSSFKYNDNRRYVFTWLKGPIPSARWKVEDCGPYSRKRRDTLDDRFENTDLTSSMKQIGAENVISSTNNATVSLPDKTVTYLLFFRIKQQSSGHNKILEESIPGSNGDTIEKSLYSRLNMTGS